MIASSESHGETSEFFQVATERLQAVPESSSHPLWHCVFFGSYISGSDFCLPGRLCVCSGFSESRPQRSIHLVQTSQWMSGRQRGASERYRIFVAAKHRALPNYLLLPPVADFTRRRRREILYPGSLSVASARIRRSSFHDVRA